jgi:outer membrane protein OmpA-like peptidoglycan-associated protein
MKKALFLVVMAVATLGMASCSKTKKLAKQHNDLQDTYKMLKEEMAEAEVSMEGEKVKVVLPEAVLFTINSAELNKEYLPIMAKMATVLNKYPKTSILITGYTDATGSDDFNLGLSKKRAENAKTVLIQNKINSDRIFVWGLGSKNPVADNNTVEGRKQNRRVEYVIMYDYKAEK